jgi:hypothetical protein
VGVLKRETGVKKAKTFPKCDESNKISDSRGSSNPKQN